VCYFFFYSSVSTQIIWSTFHILGKSFQLALYTTVEKGLVCKDLTVEINCIPPQLTPVVYVVYIGGKNSCGRKERDEIDAAKRAGF
jgi:hypothetical protein